MGLVLSTRHDHRLGEGWVNNLLSEFNGAEAGAVINHLDGLSSRIRNGGARA